MELKDKQRVKPKNKEILNAAFTAFHKETGIVIDNNNHLDLYLYDHEGDDFIRQDIVLNGIHHDLAIGVRQTFTNAVLGTYVHQVQDIEYKALLVTNYVNPQMAKRLREQGLWFIDTAGNAYINDQAKFVYIRGNKPLEKQQKVAKTRAFQTTGLKVVFAFFLDPELVNAPYRHIARKADVALGTVGWVITDLKDLGYIVDRGERGRRLIDRRRLLDRWVAAYPEQLRPKLLIDRYRGDFEPGQNLGKYGGRGYWGGEIAAAKLTGYLKPEEIIVYVREGVPKIQAALKLRKDPTGKVELLKAFWDNAYDQPEEPEITPLLLIYADLLATGDPRNIETAQMIYEQRLTGFVDED